MRESKRFFFKLWKRGISVFAAGVMAFSSIPTFSVPVSAANTDLPDLLKAGSVPASEDTRTEEQPFMPGTGGSENFRIPAIITLENGDLIAAADARWGTWEDGGGLDTIASVSGDGGKTWNYSYPLYFPDSKRYGGRSATTIIDPGIVEGPDGTVYCFADVNPTGSTTYYKTIGTGTGYVTVNGGRYLAITDNYENVETRPEDKDLTTYEYYVDDFDENGYAQILKRADGSETGYGVDEWYNLYTVTNGEYVANLTQKQVNSNTDIQQNVFYKDSLFHVYSIGYIWYVTSKDHGRTWEHPRNINDQVKRQDNENAILISPGQGITTNSGDIFIGFYSFGDEKCNSTIVYSTDNGDTWKRTNDLPGKRSEGTWSSENEIVELEDGTLRMFYRNGANVICYCDAKKNEDGEYVIGESTVTDISIWSDCNLSAITYSKKINGKQAILLACPGGSGRKNGKIFTLLVEEDKSLSLFRTFSVPDSGDRYAYSCLTELEDGTIGLLWESDTFARSSIRYDRFNILEVAQGVSIEGAFLYAEIREGKDYKKEINGEGVISVQPDESIATVVTDFENGKMTLTIHGVSAGYTKTVIDGAEYRIRVTTRNVLKVGENFDVKDAAAYTNAPEDESVIKVQAYEEKKQVMYDHTSSVASSLNSFSDTKKEGNTLEAAEFMMIASGENWRIYNEATKTYLVNSNADNFFRREGVDMKVTPTNDQGTFRICQSNDQRYVIFFFKEMNFNANGSYIDDFVNGSYELVLLEKQDHISDEDTVPGYQRVPSITSGKKYLISYIWEDGSIMVLYPENGKNNQSKLAFLQEAGIRVTAMGKGMESVVIDGQEYDFKVADPSCTHESSAIKGVIPADCNMEGYTGDEICANCGIVIKEGTSIPMLTHGWEEGVVTKEVTRTENGEKVYTCKNNSLHKRTEIIYASALDKLMTEYEKAAALMTQTEEYTTEEIAGVQAVYEEQTAVVTDKGASRSAMYGSMEALKTAVKGAEEKKAEREAFELIRKEISEAISAAGEAYAKGENSYTADTWKVFEKVYNDAGNALENTEVTKEDAETLIAALADAKNALVEKEPVVKPDEKPQETEKPAPVEKFEKGAQKVAGSGRYQVLNEKNKTAKLIAVVNRNATKLNVPAAVKIGGVACKVVEVGNKVFRNGKKLKKVILGKNVTTIGKQAFMNCKNIKTVQLKGKALKTIKKGAFQNTSAKITVSAKKMSKKQKAELLKKLKKAGMSKKAKVK